MYGLKHIDNRNFRSLLIAGIGTIGGSLVKLGIDQLRLFDHIIAVDRDADALLPLQHCGFTCRTGDINDAEFLHTLMSEVSVPSLFVNLCAGTDNLRIRNCLTSYDTAYLDSCASSTRDPGEYRYSRLMPYTYREIDVNYPHWLCWGINPGLVEIITRRILKDLPDKLRAYDVTVYEFDRLAGATERDKAAVGWCPEALVEEVMLSPTMEIIDGIPREDIGFGSRDCKVSWERLAVAARVVGHEDIWNLSEIPAVKNGRFFYSLNPPVMDILNMNDAGRARSMLYIPGADEPITGLEQVAVQVYEENMAAPKTLVWSENHETTWKNFGVNAVQYQTAKSLLLAILLLQCTDYGLMPLSLNASTLPISSGDWPIFDHFMQNLGINWQDGSHLDLHVPGN